VLACLLPAVLGLAPAAAGDEAARTLALLRMPSRALTLESDRAHFVLPLLQGYTHLLGWKLALDPSLETALAKLESGLVIPGEIAPDDVHPLIQGLARKRGLCFRFDPETSEPTLLVAAQDFDSPIAIPLEQLPAWESHPAFPLRVEIAHAPEGGEALCARLAQLLAHCPQRTDLARTDSGALRLSGSSAVLAFVAETLAEGPKLASGLDSATFPPDPNTPAGKTPAQLPESLRHSFPVREGALQLREGASQPTELEVLLRYARWSHRALLFLTDEPRSALAAAPGGDDLPASVPPDWAHEFVSGMLADSACALTPLPARRPVLLLVQRHPENTAAPLDPAGVAPIRLADLASVAHLAATRFQTFVRLQKLEAEQRKQLHELESPDPKAPFWITELDDPQVFSVIGTPRAITSAVLALRLLLAPPKPR